MASDQQFCLRWNNHQSTLVSVFDNLLESQTLVDCTLAADGQYLKAHKVVLSACSPYLESILCQNLDKHPILILKDVKFSELKAMLDYMYRGEVNISQEQLSTFLKAAESLQIKGLTDSGGGGGGGSSEPRERDLLKRQDLRKPLNQPVPHIPQPRPVVPHPGLLEPRRSLPHFPPHIADMQPQSPRHAREGSTSPTARKRRRPNRPSSDDSNFVSTPNSLSENQPDTSDSCDVPVKQSAPSTPSNVPNLSTKAQETDSPRTTPQPQINSDQKQIIVKKEFSEALLTPKTELDYGNDNSMEDVNYEDEEDEEVDLSKPGTSFATNNQGFPPWQMGGDASNDDSSIYSPDVSTAATQNNSQDEADINQPSSQLTTSELPPQAPIIIEDVIVLSSADEFLEEEAPPLSPADKTLPQDHDYVGLVIEIEPGLEPQNVDVLDQQPDPANEVEHRPSEILPGARDGSTIYHDGHGFYYHCNKTSNKKRMLRCIKTRSNGCLARASMGLSENSPILQTRNSPSHNHDPDFSKMRQARLLKRLKERSRKERSVPVSAIFSEEVLRDPEAATSLSRSNVTRCMSREKKKTQPSDFVTLEDIFHMTI